MADDFDDVRAHETFRDLRSQLGDVTAELRAARAAGEASLREATSTRQSVDTMSRRQSQAGRTAAQGVAPRAPATSPAEEVSNAERVARSARDRAAAEERVNTALGRRTTPAGAAASVEAATKRAQAAETIAAAEQVRSARQSRADRLSMDEAIERSRSSEARLRADRLTTRTFARVPPQLGPASFIPAGPGGGGTPSYDISGGGRRPPPPPPPPRGTSLGGLPEREPGDFNRRLGASHVAEEETRAAAATSSWDREMQRLSRTIGINGDDLRRHGALTTEFIAAAARGQVEIRELGYQVGATIGKFAGWTAAASLVFGAANAMHQLSTGAMDSVNAVNQVQRIITNLDTDRAQSDMRDLAREFNLPIADVGSSFYESAKIFQDYEATLNGTRSALFAMKVGELEAGDANRYLNSIVRAFPGADLADVFDTINQAQNKFGGNLSEIIAGVARAGNAFRNAGGDYSSLVALIQTGSLQTGRPGLEIATGLQRSAEHILRPERRQTIVDLLGIDPTDVSIVELYERAMAEVAHSTPEHAAEIARALSTPELATSRILPILQAAPRYRQIREEITSGNQRGSAQRELERTLKAPGEELKALGVELQNFGSALAQSGMLQPILYLVGGLREAVGLASDLLGVFGGLPSSLTTPLAMVTQIGAVMALMRRFNVGGALPAGAGAQLLARNPVALERAEILQGLGFQRNFLRDQQSTIGSQIAVQQRRARGEHDRLDRMGLDPDVDEAALERQQHRAREASARIEDLWSEHADTAEAIADTDAQERNLRDRTRRGRVRSVDELRRIAQEEGVHYKGNIGPLPVAGSAQEIAGGAPTTVIPGGTTRVGEAAERLAREEEATARETRSLSERGRRLGTSGRALGSAADAGRAALGATRTGLGAGARALSGLGTSLLGAIGPLDALIAAGLVAYSAVQKANEQARQAEEIFARPADVGALRRAASRELGDRSRLDRAQSAYAGFHNAFQGLPLGLGGDRIQAPDDAADDAARAALREADQIESARRHGRLLLQSQIRARLQQRLGHATDDQGRQRAIEQAETEMARSYGAVYGRASSRDRREWDTTESSIRQARAGVESRGETLRERLASLTDVEEVVNFALQTTTRIATQGFTGRNRSRAVASVARLRALLSTTADPKAQQQILQQIQQTQDEYAQRAQQAMEDSGVQYASPDRAGGIRSRYLAQMRRLYSRGPQRDVDALRRDRSQIRDGLDVERQRQAADAASLARVRAQQRQHGAFGTDDISLGQMPGQDPLAEQARAIERRMNSRRARIGALEQSDKSTTSAIIAARQGQQRDKEALRRIEREVDRAQYEGVLEAFDVHTEYEAGQRRDPGVRASYLADRARQRGAIVRSAVRRGIEKQSEVERSLTTALKARDDANDAAITAFEQRQELSSARFAIGVPTEEARLQRAVSDAAGLVAFIRSHGNSPDAMQRALVAQANARAAVAQHVREEAQAMIDSRAEAAISRTEDPTEQAAIRARAAQQKAAFARTPRERLDARTAVRNAERERRQTAQREQFDDIEFQASIGRIDRETQIAQLDALLHRIRGNKDLRRQIQQRMYELRHQADDTASLNLRLGDIRLPTAYELRRLVAGGSRSTAQMTTVNRNVVQVQVNGPQDYNELGRVLEGAVSGSGRAFARAAGER